MNFEKKQVILKYLKEIINAPLNLTAIKELELAYQLLAMDSLIPLRENDVGNNFLDVGTGGGVPGVFIGIMFENSRGLLVDSSRKKIDFVREVCNKLNLSNLEFLNARIEEKKDLIEKFDSVFSRAVAELRVILELTVPFSKVGGKIFLYKGKNYKEELDNAQNAIKKLNVKLKEIREYNILDKERVLLVFEKVKATDPKFPRRFNKILKQPL